MDVELVSTVDVFAGAEAKPMPTPLRRWAPTFEPVSHKPCARWVTTQQPRETVQTRDLGSTMAPEKRDG